MIRYSLKCAEGHVFDAWFRSSTDFDALAAERRVTCAICGEARVEKTLMAPSLRGEDRAPERKTGPDGGGDGGPDGGHAVQPQPPDPPGSAPASAPTPPAPLSIPATPAERALAGLRRFLSEKADYVGRRFADEARRIHESEVDERPIWGEASPEEARALHEEGVPVAPLPWLSRRDD